MKSLRSNLLITGTVAALFAGALVGCQKEAHETAGDTIKQGYENAKDATAKAWSNVKDYSFDKRDDFNAHAKSLGSRFDSEVSELRANYSDAKASASRKAAMEELKNSEADYNEKTDALGKASSATWDSAKNNVILAWDRLQAAYYKARAD